MARIPYAFRFDRDRYFGWRNFGIEFSAEPVSYPQPHKLYTITLHLWSEYLSVQFER